MKDYCRTALAYAKRVVAGKQVACEFVKLACQRQIDDLARWNGTRGAFVFDRKKANKVCALIEYFRHIKGPLAGQRIHLEPWQVFILTTVFGWVDRNGYRRFRQVYVEVPRGNGKSALSSAVALYMLLADHEVGAEVYSLATTGDQARIVFDVARRMAAKSPDLMSRRGVRIFQNSIEIESEASVFKPMASDSSTLDGLNVHFAVVDELHAHKTRDLYDVVETALGKRLQPILWTITTAGFDTSGICYEVRSDVIDILKGSSGGESVFGIIFTLDEGDDWRDPKSAEKANPNWGVSVQPKTIIDHLNKALRRPSAQANYKTKYLDVWCSASSSWMDMNAWAKCADDVELDDFAGKPCFIGLDLGAKNDLTAKYLVFPEEIEGKKKYTAFGRFYLPRDAVAKSNNSQYLGWVEEGYLTPTEGAMTDLGRVEEEIKDDLARFDVQAIAYDPWHATQLVTDLDRAGAPMVEYRNSVQNISDPMKTLEALVQDRRLVHDNNPCMNWMMSNVVARLDAKDNIYPRKERYENKIDGPVALIYALAMCTSGTPEDDEGNFGDFTDNMIVV